MKDWQQHKQGRGAASFHLTWDELETGKEQMRKFGAGVRFTKVEPDRQSLQAMAEMGAPSRE